jgi:hypothetical protein
LSIDLKAYDLCCRRGCEHAVAAGFSFCTPCLDWLTETSDVDPLADAGSGPADAAEAWAAYISMLCGDEEVAA